MKTLRIYKGKDVEMLITIDTIIDSAIANLVFLVTKRTTWRDPYLPNLKRAIDQAVQEHLGQDNAKALRNATLEVLAIQTPALKVE